MTTAGQKLPLKGQVLVVEEEAGSRGMISRALVDNGAMVMEAASQAEAWEALGKDPPPDLMIVSLKLGEKDGGAIFTRGLKTNPKSKGLPILMLVPSRSPGDVLACLDAGCDDIVSKPFFVPELVARVRGHLRSRRLYDLMAREKKDLDTLLEIHKTVTIGPDPETVLEGLVRIIAEVLKVKRATVILASNDPRFGYAVVASDKPGMRNLEVDLTRYPEIARVMKTGKPLVVEDASESSLFATIAPRLQAARVTSILAMPIVVDNEVVATLLLNTREARKKFTQREIRVCGVAATTAGFVLRSARLFAVARGKKQQQPT